MQQLSNQIILAVLIRAYREKKKNNNNKNVIITTAHVAGVGFIWLRHFTRVLTAFTVHAARVSVPVCGENKLCARALLA